MLHFLYPFIHRGTPGLLQFLTVVRGAAVNLDANISSRSCFVFFWVYIPKWSCWVLGPSLAILIEHVQAFSERSRSYELCEYDSPLAHIEGHGPWLWCSLPDRLIVQMVSLWLVSCCARPPESFGQILFLGVHPCIHKHLALESPAQAKERLRAGQRDPTGNGSTEGRREGGGVRLYPGMGQKPVSR